MGSRITGAERVYDAATKWVQRALRSDDSLFAPGKPIWSRQWLVELRQKSLDNSDDSPGDFDEMLRNRLEGSSPEVYQLFGEALSFHYLIRRTKKDTSKRERINRVLEWSPSPVQIPLELDNCLAPGLLTPGQYFNRYWRRQTGLLIEFVEQWKEKESYEQSRMLDQPWEFKDFVTRLSFRSPLLQAEPQSPRAQKEALLHLVFPDTFEAIVNVDHKNKIAKTFVNLVKQPTDDVDRQLEQIRPPLEAKYGESAHFFYRDEVRVQWDDKFKPSDTSGTEGGETTDCPSQPTCDPWTPANIEALAEDLLWEPRSKLQDIIRDLQEKGQVIFYGPPGTGKTYVAREIAKQCRLNGGDFEIVQFHPSYSYEDFVEGIRPKLIGDRAGFELVPGPLRRIADKARNNKGATYILVIDELNRGNVAKVFGELYFLLEYRDEEVRLQYGGEGAGFSLPANLWFICTMNTADRSIALMDAALRRRFYFAPFFPNEPPVQGLLRRWLHKEEQDTLTADLIDEANKNLDRDAGIGPSYFMRPGQVLGEDSVRRIWERAVVPYVEEQCFGDDAKLQRFRFDALKRQIDGLKLAEAEAPGDSITEQASDAEPATD